MIRLAALAPLAPLSLGLATAGGSLPAHAVDLIVNAGVEAGARLVQSPDAIRGWSSLEPGLIGGIASLSGTVAPGSGRSTVGARSGANHALLEISQPAYAVLYQSFTVPTAGVASAQLSYQLFATSFSDLQPPALSEAEGLDFEAAAPMLTVRVDLLKPGADPLSVSAADRVGSYLPTVTHDGSTTTATG